MTIMTKSLVAAGLGLAISACAPVDTFDPLSHRLSQEQACPAYLNLQHDDTAPASWGRKRGDIDKKAREKVHRFVRAIYDGEPNPKWKSIGVPSEKTSMICEYSFSRESTWHSASRERSIQSGKREEYDPCPDVDPTKPGTDPTTYCPDVVLERKVSLDAGHPLPKHIWKKEPLVKEFVIYTHETKKLPKGHKWKKAPIVKATEEIDKRVFKRAEKDKLLLESTKTKAKSCDNLEDEDLSEGSSTGVKGGDSYLICKKVVWTNRICERADGPHCRWIEKKKKKVKPVSP